MRNGFVRLAPDLDDVDEGFDRSSFRTLAEVEENHFWFVTRNELISWLVRRFASDASRVLEIGCGTGYTLKALRDALPNASITASELHSDGLQIARRRHGESVELLQMHAARSGLADALDLVGAFDVLEHIADDRGTLSAIHGILKPGGILIATVPQHPFLWSVSDEIAHHERRYTMAELAGKARSAGFRIRYATSFAALAFPMMAATRLIAGKGSLSDTNRAIDTEFRMTRSVNSAMIALFRLEHMLRRLGLPFPFGGSQVVVAEKPA